MSIWPQVVTGLSTVIGALVGGGLVNRSNGKQAAVTRESQHKAQLRATLTELSVAIDPYLDAAEITTLMMGKMTEDQILDWATSPSAESLGHQRAAVVRPLTQLKVEAGVYGFWTQLEQFAELWDQLTETVFAPVRKVNPKGDVVSAVNQSARALTAIRRAFWELQQHATLELSVTAPNYGPRRTPAEFWRSRSWKFWT